MSYPANILLASFLFISLMLSKPLNGQQSEPATHPCLLFTPESLADIRSKLGQVPLFDQAMEDAKAFVDPALDDLPDVPVPKDMAGGYTHERHKQNWFLMQKAGVLYLLTEDERYAVFVRDLLLAYADLFPSLPLHPTQRSYATGKIFWQCLNDANWLVYTSQAYDCIYNWLSEQEREKLEENLFRPMANFLSVESPQFFNRIHNHSTWANAAVGMIALVMDDSVLVKRALYGLEKDLIPANLRDDDRGRINDPRGAGFLAQLDYSFSPDGYFTEGPYYLRYAIYPFLLFSKSLANNRPDLGILTYRDNILRKAVYSLLLQADYRGHFFPINDAQKGMSWQAREVVTAVDMAYLHFGQDPGLLSVVQKQGRVILSEGGFAVAEAISNGNSKPFEPSSIIYRDGADGDEGGVAILRASNTPESELCLVMKYSEQGMGHGHFDKLAYSLYDETGEVIQDYGAARWVNIDQKGGGRYLRENNTWAKQSIAHNTVVVNEQSHYNGDIKIGEANHPDLYFADLSADEVQVISAVSNQAYPDKKMQRTMLLVRDEAFSQPLLLDVFQVTGGEASQYDFPTWYQGHLLSANFDYTKQPALEPFGEGHGYQHLMLEAQGKTDTGQAQICWFNGSKFYTQTTAVEESDELLILRLGANDPTFNLRPDPAFMIRKKEVTNPVFFSVLEAHGSYSPVDEIPHDPYGRITKVKVLHQSTDYVICAFEHKNGTRWLLMLAQKNADPMQQHRMEAANTIFTWQGPYALQKQEK